MKTNNFFIFISLSIYFLGNKNIVNEKIGNIKTTFIYLMLRELSKK